MISQYQTAIVTGTSRGIGPYIARALAREGMKLVLTVRSAPDLDQVATETRALGVPVLTVLADVTDPAAGAAVVAAERAFGCVDHVGGNHGCALCTLTWTTVAS